MWKVLKECANTGLGDALRCIDDDGSPCPRFENMVTQKKFYKFLDEITPYNLYPESTQPTQQKESPMSTKKEIPLPTTTKDMVAFDADRLPRLNALLDDMPHRIAKLLMETLGELKNIQVQVPAVENYAE